ncbi:ABC transporter substrate-binding protein [Pseudomonadota bacterium]
MKLDKARYLLCLLASLMIQAQVSATQIDNQIHIALIGPTEGLGHETGKGMIQGVELYLDEINQQGGINGKQIVLDRYNDGNESEQARLAAEKMISDGRAVAVIGHWYSSCSIAAGEVYAREGIAAISSGATNNRVTKENEWYFRTIFNDGSQGHYLANYAVNILDHKTITIIHETLPYGAYLGEVFEQASISTGGRISDVLSIENSDGNERLAEQVEAITAAIKQKGEDAGLIFISTHAEEAIALIKSFRDAGIDNAIMGPDSLSTAQFWDGFRRFSKEQSRPGYYTQDVYITSPINFDAADEEAQQFQKRYRKKYAEEATWIPAYTYDAAKVIVAAIKQANITGDKNKLTHERRAIRDQLNTMTTLDTAVKGVTGYNVFDQYGDTDKPVSVAQYHNNNIVSSMVNFSVVTDPDEVVDLKKALNSGRITQINGRYMYRKNMVYTGIKLHKIGEYKESENRVALDFTLWFRFRGDFNPQNIEFLNAVSPVELGNPIHSEHDGNIQYLAYRINSDFRTNFLPSRVPFGEHMIGFTFRHNELNRNSIVYITDVIGMGLTKTNHLDHKIKNGLQANGLEYWQIEDVSFYEGIRSVDTLGVPTHLNNQQAQIPFSEYHVALTVQKVGTNLRGSLPTEMSGKLTLMSLGLIFLIMALKRIKRLAPYLSFILILKIVAAVLFLIALEIWLSDNFLATLDDHLQTVVIRLFDISWWLVPAILVLDAINIFVWNVLQRKSGRNIPGVVRGLISAFVYTLALFGIIATVFDQQLTGLFVTSGVIAMIIGLAIQVNLSNIFSGIALNIERPFRVGDWVKIDNNEGEVVDINWRATRIRNRQRQLISIPNTPVSDAPIVNYSASGYSRISATIDVHPIHPVEEVKRLIMNAALSVPDILREPFPETFFHGIKQGMANYILMYSFNDYGEKNRITGSLWDHILKYLTDAGITFATPQSRIEMNQTSPEPIVESDVADLFRYIKDIEKFPKGFSQGLVDIAHPVTFATGERLAQQGEKGGSMYVVAEGVLSVLWKDENAKEEIEVGRLSKGGLWGGYALLWHKPRMASIDAVTPGLMFELKSRDLEPLLERYPEASIHLKQITNEQIDITSIKASEYRSQKQAESTFMTRLRQGVSRWGNREEP